jgi:hypothetical protein
MLFLVENATELHHACLPVLRSGTPRNALTPSGLSGYGRNLKHLRFVDDIVIEP